MYYIIKMHVHEQKLYMWEYVKSNFKKIWQIRNYNSLEKIKKLEKIKRHIDENN